MNDLIAKFREEFGLRVAEKKDAWEVYVPRSEFVFEVLIPRDGLEWYVTVKDKATGKEVWSDWMEHYGSVASELSAEMEADISRFIQRLLRSEVRLVQAKRFFIRQTHIEWNSNDKWERLSLFWE